MAYDLKSVKAPDLKGSALRLVTAMLENALIRPLLLPGLLKSIGVTAFRRTSIESAPTPFPLVKARDTPRCQFEGPDAAENVASSASQSIHPGFRFASISDYARAYRDQRLSPKDVARRIIDAVESSNRSSPPLRAIIQCDAEDLMRQAAESTARLTNGRSRGILEGVPVAIKDELDMLPYPTQVGTSFLGKSPAVRDATVVKKLRAAGAILIGKTNMFEIGISPTGNNPIHGFARNPYDLDFDAGGSSGGSAAAVGSGIVPLAIGADGGGSIRIPAAHCGVVGLKPTFGRVSEFGAAPLCQSVAHIGPLGATAHDAAIGYALGAGRDSLDPMTISQPPVHLQDFHHLDLSGITLGLDRVWFEDAAPDVVGPCMATLHRLEKSGALIKEVAVDGLEATRVAHAITILVEMAAAMEPYYDEHRRKFCHTARLNLALGRQFTRHDYLQAQRARSEAMQEWERIFNNVDSVMTPTTACPPPYLDPRSKRFGESNMKLQTELMRFVVCGNLCGMPAISFPAGYTKQGLPVGIQAIGRHWQEHLLLRLAHVAEQGLERHKPNIHFEMLSDRT